MTAEKAEFNYLEDLSHLMCDRGFSPTSLRGVVAYNLSHLT